MNGKKAVLEHLGYFSPQDDGYYYKIESNYCLIHHCFSVSYALDAMGEFIFDFLYSLDDFQGKTDEEIENWLFSGVSPYEKDYIIFACFEYIRIMNGE